MRAGSAEQVGSWPSKAAMTAAHQKTADCVAETQHTRPRAQYTSASWNSTSSLRVMHSFLLFFNADGNSANGLHNPLLCSNPQSNLCTAGPLLSSPSMPGQPSLPFRYQLRYPLPPRPLPVLQIRSEPPYVPPTHSPPRTHRTLLLV